MPNIFDENGLQVKTRQELLDELTSAYRRIYGPDINLNQDTPDGQILNIFVQAYNDVLDLLVKINSSFDPNQAFGTILDQRVGINGIQRLAGTRTITNISIQVDSALNLYGRDQDVEDVFTVSDNEGNQFELIRTHNFSSSGTFDARFQAVEVGEVSVLPNTITNQVTVVLGVVSVNNSSAIISLGENEESDEDLRLRRSRSVSISSSGFLASLYAELNSINGVTEINVSENNTRITNSEGLEGNSIWVIVGGNALDEDIAEAIYSKRGTGVNMRGDQSFNYRQVDGSFFNIKWDNIIEQNVFVMANISSINGINSVNLEDIRGNLNLRSSLFSSQNGNNIASQIQNIDSNALVSDVILSNGKRQFINFNADPRSGVFKIRYNGNISSNIIFNFSKGELLGAITAVPGLENVTVRSSNPLNTNGILIEFQDDSVPHLITIAENTTNAEITTSLSQSTFYTSNLPNDILLPDNRRIQFVYNQSNLIFYNIIILGNRIVEQGGTIEFRAVGGYGVLTFDLMTDVSGATITQEGVYTAGLTEGIDVIRVTDERGIQTIARITVT